MVLSAPTNLKELDELLRRPEGETLEWKRSTGELRDALQTVCAFLNGKGGLVLFGIRPDGRVEGQQVSDQTMRDIAEAFDRLEPPYKTSVERIDVGNGREVLVLRVERGGQKIPFTYDGRPYQRVSSTTRRMPKDEHEDLVLERMHSRRRWENQPADEISFKDIDRDEVFRVLKFARSVGRLSGPTGRSTVEMLVRLGVHKDGQFLRAAVVLFGKTFLPDYPQCELRMARFRGTDKTEFLDQRSLRGPAFKLLDEAELFCQRHFPLPAKIVSGQWRRVEKTLIPVDAMREILVNAFIHRDYSIAGGAVSLAIFDDRVEVWSAGTFPRGITPAMLTGNHLSVQRNPIIAEVFHRAGLIERWGRGTNKVVEACLESGIAAPTFEEITGGAVVTFRVAVGSTVEVTPQVTPQVAPQVAPQVTPQVVRILAAARQARSRLELQEAAGIGDREHFRKAYLLNLVRAGWLAALIPDKPNSRLQKYRITVAGKAALKKGGDPS